MIRNIDSKPAITKGLNPSSSMCKHLILLTLFLCIVLPRMAFSQQYDQYSLYMFSPGIYNPASAGMSEALNLQAGWRNQWIGFTDQEGNNVNPKSYFAAISAPIYAINSGLGLMISRQDLAYQQRTDIRLDYALKIPFKEGQFLSVGISGKLSRLNLNIDKLIPTDPTDPLIKKTGSHQSNVPEMGTGLLYTSKKLMAGISLMNLLGSEFELGNIIMQDQPTFTAMAQYRINLIEERFKKVDLAPSFLIKSSINSTQIDLNLLGYVNDRFWGGAGYRLQDGLILMAGAGLGQFDAGISYDFTTSKMKEATGKGSLELQIRYGFPVYPPVRASSGFNTRHL